MFSCNKTINEMPNHGHDIYTGSSQTDGNVDIYWGGNGRAARSPSTTWNAISRIGEAGICITNGGNAAHNNMPSYQTLYAWRRTA